ncbi:MAG: cytochrome c oxidase subunit II [Methylophilaceae bacterium]|nr:MAG: cytochrome c oxidase subunit II [Methylophilaceae bacterium]
MNKRTILSLGAAFLSLFTINSHADYALNLKTPATEIASQIYDLHMLILWVCVAIFIVVFGLMFYSIVKHRKSVGHKAAQFHEHHWLEIIWTIIPVVILVVMAYPATKTILAMKDTAAADMSIKITGYQWKWGYDYLDQNVKFISTLSTPQDQIHNKEEKGENYLLEVDNPMVVPVGQKVRLLITAADVIHAWWIPEFGVKQDAIPGFMKEAWIRVEKPGTYRGQCAELCGKEHGYMPIVVEAMEQADYDAWVVAQQDASAAASAGADKEWAQDDLITAGKAVYEKNCSVCHGATGAGIPPAFPAMTGSAVVTGPIETHLDMILNGKNIMPAWKAVLNDVDIAAVIAYERNALGNSTGDSIQPSAVKAAR